MFTTLDHRAFAMMMPPEHPSGGIILVAMITARWAFLLGPASLVWLWVLGPTHDRRAAVNAALTAILGLLVAHAISSLVFMPRPFMEGPVRNYLDHASDSSFPSDHCTLLFCLAFGFWTTPPSRRPNLRIALLGLALAVGWSRVYLGAHYPSDVIGAALLAAVVALLTTSAWGRSVTARLTAFGEALWPSVV